MAWLESHQALGAHPKTKKLCRILSLSKPEAVGYLHLLWWWALDYAEDGNLSRYDALDIAIGAEWEGDEGAFVDGLVSAGFLDRSGDSLVIHDWHDYAGKLIERRARNAERMREARAKDDPPTNTPRATHVQRTPDARVQLPNQTVPNQPNPTGEKPPVVPRAAPKPAAKPEPKPRTEKQKASDELYERKMRIVAAYFRGLGIQEGTLPWTQRKGKALGSLTVAILDSPECVPEIIEPLTRYTSSAFQWRHGKKTPELSEVLLAFPEWDAEGRPERATKEARAPTPIRQTTQNGRQLLSRDDLIAIGNGESLEHIRNR